jgi:hypothetical protein
MMKELVELTNVERRSVLKGFLVSRIFFKQGF